MGPKYYKATREAIIRYPRDFSEDIIYKAYGRDMQYIKTDRGLELNIPCSYVVEVVPKSKVGGEYFLDNNKQERGK